MSEELEATLVQKILRGDHSAFGDLFSLHRDRLWRIVQFRLDRRLRGRVDADDILQESYMNAVQRLDSFLIDASQSCFVWLRLIVSQTMIDIHRAHIGAQKRDARLDRSLHGGWDSASTSFSLSSHLMAQLTSPSSAAVRAEFSELVDTALTGMSELDREVLALRHYEELTNRETSQVLGITEQAASLRYVRALSRLRDVVTAVSGEER